MPAATTMNIDPNRTTAQALTAQGTAPVAKAQTQPQQAVTAPATTASQPVNQAAVPAPAAPVNKSTQPLIARPVQPLQAAPTMQWDANNMTVEGRLNGLLQQDNAYIKQAQQRAKEDAAKRGLMNSTMAVQAGQEAAIAQALPIAQQDAKTYYDRSAAEHQMQGQFGMQSNQFGHEREQLDRQHEQGKEMAGINFANQSTLQDKELTSQEKLAKLEQESRALLQREQLTSQEAQGQLERDSRAQLQQGQITSQEKLALQEQQNRTLLQREQLASQAMQADLDRQNQQTLQKGQIASQEKLAQQEQALKQSMQQREIIANESLARLNNANQQELTRLQAMLEKDLTNTKLAADQKRLQMEINAKAVEVNKTLTEQMKMHYAETQRANITAFSSEVQAIQQSDIADKEAAILKAQARYDKSAKYLADLYMGTSAVGKVPTDRGIWDTNTQPIDSKVSTTPKTQVAGLFTSRSGRPRDGGNSQADRRN